MSRETPGKFATTRWSIVDRAGHLSDVDRRAALDTLLKAYREPMCRFLTARFGHPREIAEDTVQGFVVANVLEKNLLAEADEEKGRFRTFLLTALKRYAANEWRSAQAQRRGGGKVAVVAELPEIAEVEATDAFDVAWARQVLAAAVQHVQEECRGSGRNDIWGVFESRMLGPILEQREPPSYAELVERFKLESPAQASNLLVSGKRMFIRALRAVVAEYGASEEDVEQEIADLQAILAQGV